MSQAPTLPPPAQAGRALTDRGAVVVAVTTAAGAWWANPLPLAVGMVVLVVAFAAQRPMILAVAGFALASALGARSLAGLSPVVAQPFDGEVTLVGDPRPTPWGTTVDVRVGSRRVQLVADGAAAGTVGRALAGEQLLVRGRLEPPPPDSPWLVPRHISGRLDAREAQAHHAGGWSWRAANRFRRLLMSGASGMDEPARQLYGGFVLGDQSAQSVEVVDDFRAGGLTHLLVVSGSNVAYLLVLLSPLKGRLPLVGQWLVTVVVIASFALVTRFEPSVLRASAMAALAVGTGLAGRPTASLRVLALAVSGLLLIDPLLVRSVGFQLSVAATLGIVLGSGPIARALPGPELLAKALAVTVSAQLAVAPLLAPRFGGVPVVAVPANLVAAPAAGLVTMWGLPAGVVAGLAGPGVAHWVHLPTEVGIGWVAGTARVAASAPLGQLTLGGVALVAGLAGLWLLGRRRAWWWPVRVTTATAMALVLLAPALALRHPPALDRPAPGLELHRRGGATVLVVSSRASPADALEGLRLAGVRRLDVVVLEQAQPDLMVALSHRWTVTRVVVGDQQTVPLAIQVGGLRVQVPASRSGVGAPEVTAGTLPRSR